MSYREDGDDVRVIDLEQRHIAAAAKRYNEFSKEGIVVGSFPTRPRKFFEKFHAFCDRFARTFCRGKVTIRKKGKKPFQIIPRAPRLADLKAHFFLGWVPTI
jgi:hypothetical protein